MSEWKREIKKLPAQLVHVSCPDADLDDVRAWLQTKAKEHSLYWLLAHADDGVIWGKILDDETLVTSNDAAQGDSEAARIAKGVCPPLRRITLQQARLFSKDAELLLWRDGDNIFHARLIVDTEKGQTPSWNLAFDEPQLLWGTQGTELAHGFTLLEDGAQGLRHAVPIEVASDKFPVSLCVRHYLAREDLARVVVSRLTGLSWKEK